MVCFALLGTVAFLHSKKRTKIATRNWTRKWTQQKGTAVFNNIVDSTAKILKRDNVARRRLCFVQSYYACWKLLFFHFFQFPLKVFEVINKYFNRHSRSSSTELVYLSLSVTSFCHKICFNVRWEWKRENYLLVKYGIFKVIISYVTSLLQYYSDFYIKDVLTIKS